MLDLVLTLMDLNLVNFKSFLKNKDLPAIIFRKMQKKCKIYLYSFLCSIYSCISRMRELLAWWRREGSCIEINIRVLKLSQPQLNYNTTPMGNIFLLLYFAFQRLHSPLPIFLNF